MRRWCGSSLTNPLLTAGDPPPPVRRPAIPRASAVDNTFATALRQKPPISAQTSHAVHNQAIGGHSDFGGVVTTRDAELLARLRTSRSLSGRARVRSRRLDPGVRTMAMRLDRAEANAVQLVERLDATPVAYLLVIPASER